MEAWRVWCFQRRKYSDLHLRWHDEMMRPKSFQFTFLLWCYMCYIMYIYIYIVHIMSYVFTSMMSYDHIFICGMCGILCALCAAFSVRSVQSFVCVMCGLSSVRCAVFSLCYVQFAVTSLAASLRACLASLAWLASLALGSSKNTWLNFGTCQPIG